ncbi:MULTISPECIES: hypothetical protein [Asanoa]|uniref:Uncharacterized protein n=2 Tax=Asanoa TaxID=195964 RepID=A0A239PGD8_9ACTN|nr:MULTISPECIES: hypothetical protein [Asanoa]GIF75651.1 hypothetical protein Asi02nite_51690 [Asanoa siamensis]SNT65875.1 hypothetical protein SAMN05421812_12821 [Asanoa hainanensis]
MLGVDDQSGWAATALLAILPALVLPAGVVLVALLALAARKPRTRRHCLDVLSQLTRYAGRSRR